MTKKYSALMITLLSIIILSCSSVPGTHEAQRIISSVTSANESDSTLDSAYLKNCHYGELPEWITNKNSLSKAQVTALYNYTLADFDTINPILAKGATLDECQNIQVQLIDTALNKIPPYRGVVYRGTSVAHFSAIPNAKIILEAYTSTSTNKEGAEAFIRGRLLIITVKGGRSISTYSNAPDEAEILLPRGTSLLIKKVSSKEMELFSEEKGPYKEMVQVVEAEEI